ncbi:MAG: phosphatidate cytidylyltransferase [Endomicrobium sp.]|jgi:phosphatidate cytidylyltransferase|uniref:phosphatidate cytidylyltransferase n=1 Tax=Candidatus Endomicrobiellum cubanum TaxID=3242325 RepID=UPI00281F8F26|nr:phosphatidate cytidylyltransferase [Endomicrobium sp.]
MLLTRILTAVVCIPAVFSCIFLGNIPFYLMMFIVSFFCVYEYLNISKKYNPHRTLSLVSAVLFFLFLQFFNNCPINKVSFSAIVIALTFFIKEVFGKSPKFSVERIAISFFGTFFIPLSLIHMVYLRNLYGGMEIIFFIFLVVWVLDTAAYAFGFMCGKHKLAQYVSPKKTVEGAIAGVIFGVLTAFICRTFFMKDVLSVHSSLILGFIIAVAGQFSDLAESLIKRDGDIKDSGKAIPGHGGFFDRFDSYIFAAPAVYYVLKFLE